MAPLGFEPIEASAHLSKQDKKLAKLIAKVGPCTMKLEPTRSVYLALARAIVYQQLHGKAAATIFGRLCALFPDAKHGPGPEHIQSASDEALRGVGLSRNKLCALRDLAEKSRAGLVPTLVQLRKLDDEAIVEKLTAVRGIGRWTVEMMLMFRLGRPDVLPVGDYGVRKGFAITYGKKEMPTPQQLTQHAERWRPYRSVASWYMWRATEL